ncbi:MAG TPA: hypothetical protein VGP13_01320, partial [Candidatus Paceibacterota bacterium]|nr:hypothetical protein [Candidatus Paceibacterota bacterium]
RGPSVNGSVSQVGQTIMLDNSLGGYNGVAPQQTVMLSNLATAALYRYTPHVFNGNYNFWRYFNAWFKYPNGTLLKLASDSQVYIIQNGSKQPVPPFVAQARGLNLAIALTVSQNEFDSYPKDKVYSPADNTIITVNGQLFVFITNIKHPASAFVISQRKLNPANAISVTDADAALFDNGPTLTPSDGTILRGQTDLTVYLITNGSLQQFSPFTFSQRNAAKSVQIIPDSEVASYPKAGFVPPLAGTLIKAASNGTVFLVDAGFKRSLSGELFRNRGFSFKNVVILSDAEVAALPDGGMAMPKDNTYFKLNPSGGLYVYKEGTKHKVSAFVAKQKHISADFTFNDTDAAKWTDGLPIVPKDNTVVKGDGSATVYLVVSGQLRPLTAAAFAKRKIKVKSIVILPQTEVDSYGQGDVLAQ